MDDTIDWVVRSNYTARRIAQDSTEDAVLIIDKMVAEERAGGRHGNKGDECAITALKMIDFYRRNLEE